MDTRIRRTGIVVGALAAALFLAGAFVLDGYATANRASAGSSVPAGQVGGGDASAAASPDTVFVLPAPSAAVIHVTERASAEPAPVEHVVVPGVAGGDDGHEGGDD